MSVELRDEIRRVLLESIDLLDEWTAPQNTFPYDNETLSEPQQIDPIADYVINWDKFSTNNSVFEFPKEEFELGLRIERDKDPASKLLDIASKVIDVLKREPNFYSSMNSRVAV